jgi:mono/diheme cytochrome c family protein
MERGQRVYRDACISCHLDDGSGVEGVYPPLAGSDYLMAHRNASIRGIKYGQRGPMVVNGLTYDNTMLPMGLSDQQIADVMNFIRNSWGNQTEEAMVTAEEVARVGPR